MFPHTPLNPDAKPGEERMFPSTMRLRRRIDLEASEFKYPANSCGNFVLWSGPISEIIVNSDHNTFNIDALSTKIFGSRRYSKLFFIQLSKRDRKRCLYIDRWDLQGVYVPLEILNRFVYSSIESNIMKYSVSTLVRCYLATHDPALNEILLLQRKELPIAAYDILPDSERDNATLSLHNECTRFNIINSITFLRDYIIASPLRFSWIFNPAVTIVIENTSSTYNLTRLSIDLFASTKPVSDFYKNCSQTEQSLFTWRSTKNIYCIGYYVPHHLLSKFALLHTTINTHAIQTLIQFHLLSSLN